MPTTNGHAVNTGCVLDSHFGWHNHARMIAVAVDLGWPITPDDQAMVDAYDAGDGADDSAESIVAMMDDAERWLNDHTPPVCVQCGEPVESRPTGWYSHVGLRGSCDLRLSDSAQRYVWHWSNGDFVLSPMCDDDDCDDDTCAHWEG